MEHNLVTVARSSCFSASALEDAAAALLGRLTPCRRAARLLLLAGQASARRRAANCMFVFGDLRSDLTPDSEQAEHCTACRTMRWCCGSGAVDQAFQEQWGLASAAGGPSLRCTTAALLHSAWSSWPSSSSSSSSMNTSSLSLTSSTCKRCGPKGGSPPGGHQGCTRSPLALLSCMHPAVPPRAWGPPYTSARDSHADLNVLPRQQHVASHRRRRAAQPHQVASPHAQLLGCGGRLLGLGLPLRGRQRGPTTRHGESRSTPCSAWCGLDQHLQP